MEPSFQSTFLSSSWAPWNVILVAGATQRRHGTFIPVYFPIIQLGALECNSSGRSDTTETWNLHSSLLSYHPVGPWNVILVAGATQRRHGTFIPVYFPIIQLGALECNSSGRSDTTETWNLHSCLFSYHPVGRPGM